MENKAMYLTTVSDTGSIFEEPFDGRSLSKLNLCEDGPCHKRRTGGCCTQLGSLSALKHAVLGLYLLVFLILVGIFILAVVSLHTALLTVAAPLVKAEAGTTVSSIACFIWDELLAGAA
ncbi:PREDICTED: scavenger receptor class A member 5 [Myotis brandtii]|uniref:scavenger receptor class A member 5 n=1 Tax=Myotis brandtii TaxID=109478 RepID=UPI000704264C|nr:PREDICTED: scavenger receptor class A member 5 [Myotis brandtii]